MAKVIFLTAVVVWGSCVSGQAQALAATDAGTQEGRSETMRPLQPFLLVLGFAVFTVLGCHDHKKMTAAAPEASQPSSSVSTDTHDNQRSIALPLDGAWRLVSDPRNPPPPGFEKGWCDAVRPEAVDVPVPGIAQQGLPGKHLWFWYYRNFTAPTNPHPGGRYLLRFEAVDYQAWVWLNGKPVGEHEGPETPFTLDVTEAVRPGQDNLLAVRVLNWDEGGAMPSRAKSTSPEWMKYGGITGRVELRTAQPVRIEDLYARPDPATGIIAVQALIRNAADKAATGRVEFTVAPAASGSILHLAAVAQTLPPGDTTVRTQLRVEHPHLWNLDDPYLYRVTARVTPADEPSAVEERSVRCGFRDFRVTDGYFYLNGKRVFVKSTHTVNHVPLGWITPPDCELLRRDLLYAKASGFNMVRFITSTAWPDQLDLCDELGLMVYEESCAAWNMKDSPKLAERFDRSLREAILRDRNHPCVTIWGLLNEEVDTPVFRHAVAALSVVRQFDDARLVLLSSGRWDGHAGIGSVSNPGSAAWEHQWGGEAPGVTTVSSMGPNAYLGRIGDVHTYPNVPQTAEFSNFIRGLGQGTKPVFLSEYGIGSLMNVINETRHYEQAGAREDLESYAWIRAMSDRFEADWKRLGLDGVYPFPEDLLADSQRLHARQRLLGFDVVRANPRLCGYNLTGMLDHVFTGEGLWTFWRRWKPATFDAVSDGWAPLRWCLFVDAGPASLLHAYAGRPVTLEAVLANEDVLKPGDYPVCLRVVGPAGIAWEKKVTLTIPAPAPGSAPLLAVPVLKEQVVLPGPTGAYVFAAAMERGGAPEGGRLKFYLTDEKDIPDLKKMTVTTWGIEESAQRKCLSWLAARGLTCRPLASPPPDQTEVILVGDQFPVAPTADQWKDLARRIARGSTVIFLSPSAFQRGEDSMGWLPLVKKGRRYDFWDWIYHKECVANRHPAFQGLQGPGVMDWDYYGGVIGTQVFDGQDTPDEVIAAAFAVGYGVYYPGSACPTGYASGVLIGGYRLGAGRFYINSLRLLETVGSNPATDRLLLNLVAETGRRLPAAPAELPGTFDAELDRIYP